MSASAKLIWNLFKETNLRQCWLWKHRKSGLFKDTVNCPEHKSPNWVSGISSCLWLYFRLVSVSTDSSLLNFWALSVTCPWWPSSATCTEECWTLEGNCSQSYFWPSRPIHPLLKAVVQLTACAVGVMRGLSWQTHNSCDEVLLQLESGEVNVFTEFQRHRIF